MDIIIQKKKNFLINNLDKQISDKLIKKYLDNREFESAIFYILRVYYHKSFLELNQEEKKLDKVISFLKDKYLDKYYNYNENNINITVIEIGLIIKRKDGYKSVINKYKNTVEHQLNEFFFGRYPGTFLGTKVLPRYI